MFNPKLITALVVIAQSWTEEGYLERQDALLQSFPGEYDELVDIACDVEESAIRIEALELVALAARDCSRTKILTTDSTRRADARRLNVEHR